MRECANTIALMQHNHRYVTRGKRIRMDGATTVCLATLFAAAMTSNVTDSQYKMNGRVGGCKGAGVI